MSLRKKGKPNTFLKGMKVDMDPSLQPPHTYRDAKNIRLVSHEGGNVSAQPYDSDKKALGLTQGTQSVTTTPILSNISNWITDISGYFEVDDYVFGGEDIISYGLTNNLFNIEAGTGEGLSYYYNYAWLDDWGDDGNGGTIDFGNEYNYLPKFMQAAFFGAANTNSWVPSEEIINEFYTYVNGITTALPNEISGYGSMTFKVDLSVTGVSGVYRGVVNMNSEDIQIWQSQSGNTSWLSGYISTAFNELSTISLLNSNGELVEEVNNFFEISTSNGANNLVNWNFTNVNEPSEYVSSFDILASGTLLASIDSTSGGGTVLATYGKGLLLHWVEYIKEKLYLNQIPMNYEFQGGNSNAATNYIQNEQIDYTFGNVFFRTLESETLNDIIDGQGDLGPFGEDIFGANLVDTYLPYEYATLDYLEASWGSMVPSTFSWTTLGAMHNTNMMIDALYWTAAGFGQLAEQYFNELELPDSEEITIPEVLIASGQPSIDIVQVNTTWEETYAQGFTEAKKMQILGHYGFSDYLVLLGKWNEQADVNGYATDFVIKTAQKKDGTLSYPGDAGYELFYQGNLGFSDKKRVKVVGTEENEKVRRIYFTDGDIPLRTMNVGASQSIYYSIQNDPDSFNIFVKSKLSIPEITGFGDGGALDSIAYSYCFRYKTADGRYSRMSPITNPACVPVSSKGTEAAFTKGGAPGTSTNKSIFGKIENLDLGFDSVEMIFIPYINGAPGTAEVFATYPIPSTGTIQWTHSGGEDSRIEIISAEFGTDNISWDSCKALGVKDNRLFCGNLTGKNVEIADNFKVKSYNSKNQKHSTVANPHLFHDLLYSHAGLTFNGDSVGIYSPRNQNDGKYLYPNWADYYRYIKGPGVVGEANAGLYFSLHEAPVRPLNTSGDIDFNWEARRGIFGAESDNFNTPLESGDFEGVRVTFRMLDTTPESPAAPIQLDNKDNLINSGDFSGSKPPFYNLDKNSTGYYASYANPVYNSNHVGYRRGEIYRFGILFYDKKGQPMFVKRIGDVRMPEHSTEYIKPKYSSGTISQAKTAWPWYYQTSRHSVDNGFSNWPNPSGDSDDYDEMNGGGPYGRHPQSPGEGQYAGVVYPYFEVKLSSDTTSKVGGYSIVRVPRTSDDRTIITSGILNRAVSYASINDDTIYKFDDESYPWNGANRTGMADRFGDDPIPFWTRTQQAYNSTSYGQPWATSPQTSAGNPDFVQSPNLITTAYDNSQSPINLDATWHASNVYTIDSPETTCDDNFLLPGTSGGRLKIVESRYCIKQNVRNTTLADPTGNIPENEEPWIGFFNKFLSGGNWNSSASSRYLPSGAYPDYTQGPWSIDLFACHLQPALLMGEGVQVNTGDEVEFLNIGSWKHYFSRQSTGSTNWNSEMSQYAGDFFGDSEKDDAIDFDPSDSVEYGYGIYTKFYSKRIGAYPMYGMARPDWIKRNIGGTGQGMDIKQFGLAGAFEYPYSFISNNGYGSNFDETSYPSDVTSADTYLGSYEQGVRACNILPDVLRPQNGLNPDDGDFYRGEDIRRREGTWPINGYWYESNIQHMQIVSPGEEIDSGTLFSDRPYKNATMWHDFHKQNNDESWSRAHNNPTDENYYKWTLGANTDTSEDQVGNYSEENADYALGNRKIVLSLKHHGAMPITRHCIAKDNWKERVYLTFGNAANGGTYPDPNWSQFSPEVTVASLTTGATANTLYGGNSVNAFNNNIFQSCGHFTPVNEESVGYVPGIGAFARTGKNGHHVFGGDTFVCNYSIKKVHNPSDDSDNFFDRTTFTGYTAPIETEVNLDLRYGTFLGSSTADISRYFEDDFGSITYNSSFNTENSILSFIAKPLDFIEVFEWPYTVSWSEPKFPGDYKDSFSVFTAGQFKDLDYSKGPITQLLLLQNELFALQNSGTCHLSVNPRVMIPSGEGKAITTITGTDAVLERYDYVSDSFGSQHIHGRTITPNNAYYYDDNACKFLKLGKSKSGGWSVVSLGDSLGMQSYFQSYNNKTIGDNPLSNTVIRHDAGLSYDNVVKNWHSTYGSADGAEIPGGITIGYDIQYDEVLLTLYPHLEVPKTIVYNEKLDAFTSFISKRGAEYITYRNRMYTLYDNPEDESLNSLYLSNGYTDFSAIDMTGLNLFSIQGTQESTATKYLNFGAEDFYIFANPNSEELLANNNINLSQKSYAYPSDNVVNLNNFVLKTNIMPYKEPVHIVGVVNDEVVQPKVFDSFDVLINPEQDAHGHLYFRKFGFQGSANPNGIHEFDMTHVEDWQDSDGVPEFPYIILEGFSNSSPVYPAQNVWVSNEGVELNPTLPLPSFSGPYINDTVSSSSDYVNITPWYTYRDGVHNVPMRRMENGLTSDNSVENQFLNVNGEGQMRENRVRGFYAIYSMVMGFNRAAINETFGLTEIDFRKNYTYNIFSVIPNYRYSKR